MRSSVRLLALFVGSVASISCLGNTTDSVVTSGTGTAWVQFVNTTQTSLQFLDAYDNTIDQSILPQTSSSCFAVDPVATGLLVAPAATGGLTEVELPGLTVNDTFVVTAMPGASPGSIQYNVFFQAFTPAAGDAGIRVISAAPVTLGDVGQSIDAYVVAGGTTSVDTTLAASLQPSASAIAFPHGSGYFNVAPGTFDVAMTPTGFKKVIADARSVTVTAGTLTTVVVADPASDSVNLNAFVASVGCGGRAGTIRVHRG